MHNGQEDGPSSALGILANAAQAAGSARDLLEKARASIRAAVGEDGKLVPALVERQQHAAHGLSWLATYVCAIEQCVAWGDRLLADGRFGETEQLLLGIGLGEYLSQILGGIAMSQSEFVRPGDLGIGQAEVDEFRAGAVSEFVEHGNTPATRARLASLLMEGANAASLGDPGLDETMEAMREEIRKFNQAEVKPHAQGWHLSNAYIPLEVIARMGEIGVFGLTIPEEYGGLGLSKVATCVVTEELSRGYLSMGSVGTRSEIAAELILASGTDAQKRKYLPGIASGEIIPAAVFTEPDTGSDLASLRTRAMKEGEDWLVTGAKTWITHPVRADLLTLLVRTEPDERGHRGLSMLLAEKSRGSDEDPFPVEGLSGTEIEVIGYRGMKEYELAFDRFRVSGDNLLGDAEGQGFRQLMQTFESARIQTAARAVGVAQAALDLGLRYAGERKQFGKPLSAFPRISDKLAMMAVEINLARQLTYHAARKKDGRERCDLEAGMAKLLGARVAWACADCAVQVHGGNGFAAESEVSRVLCDARILSIFEGTAEIQAEIIFRRILDGGN